MSYDDRPAAIQRPEDENKVYVGGLSFSTTENGLRRTFEDMIAPNGRVVHCQLMMDPEGRSRGFAFVTMDSDDSMQLAIEKLNQRELDGRTITVSKAEYRPRNRFPAGGRGGYDDRGGYERSDYRDRAPKSNGFRVSLSGLPSSYTWRELKDFLRTGAPSVTYANVSRPGYGVGEYASAQDRSDAIRALDGRTVEGCTVYVKVLEHNSDGDGYRGGGGSADYRRGGSDRYADDRGYEREDRYASAGYERGSTGYERGSGYERGGSGYERSASGYERSSDRYAAAGYSDYGTQGRSSGYASADRYETAAGDRYASRTSGDRRDAGYTERGYSSGARYADAAYDTGAGRGSDRYAASAGTERYAADHYASDRYAERAPASRSTGYADDRGRTGGSNAYAEYAERAPRSGAAAGGYAEERYDDRAVHKSRSGYADAAYDSRSGRGYEEYPPTSGGYSSRGDRVASTERGYAGGRAAGGERAAAPASYERSGRGGPDRTYSATADARRYQPY
mmetsp:Transcript_23159/g.50841  ORF Transcript_23159/g.50841 Transcript_23159/m.50841 type:complete len:508 (+) Transcript_23159:97-1620(+)|eukprot:CAMPEP_0202895366 /NCGR_PEP_ID=MMETSP1392-20130828/4585_1 /ASSEMBLY_ACC=CAM_ASM_000868 /TAXON_ID=225041 /ORGANISM="Chlamydomonas chlamydogama, Strain SAG 11-48b" /LENGTH=507 /DNA_ID=CAMNT_0049580355 /DNA_START=59 /DNA_END=1582 /DNA_ORIENTATION=-